MVAEGRNTHAIGSFRVRAAATALVVAGLVGTIAYLVEAFAPPSAATEQYNYPVGPEVFVAVQVLYGIQHLALAWGLLGLIWSGAVPPSSLGTPSAYAASGAVALLAVVQFVAIGAAGETRAEFFVDMLDESFGFIAAAVGLTLVLTGIAVAYAGRWRGGWRYLPLALGIYVFIPLIPALTAPMGVARVILAGWMTLFALMGIALFVHNRDPRRTTVQQSTPGGAVPVEPLQGPVLTPVEGADGVRRESRRGSDLPD